MNQEEFSQRHAEAVEQFNRQEHRDDGEHVAASLTGGMAILRGSLYSRVHREVEKRLGTDTMLVPVSEQKTEKRTKTEIDLYQIAESAAAVLEHAYIGADSDWYLQWLTLLRTGHRGAGSNTNARLRDYVAMSADDRRLAFTDVLARVLPESTRAPLVLFRLLPLSVHTATALAFGDHTTALDTRSRQTSFLPAINYCNKCQGKVLDNGEQCPGCGNPLWKYEWLTAAD